MQSADRKLKAAERAIMVAFLSGAIALVGLVIATWKSGFIASTIAAIVLIVAALFSLPKKGAALLHRYTRGRFLGFLGIFIPIAGTLIFSLYPVTLGLGAAAGISLPSSVFISGILIAIATLANLAMLVVNAVAVLKWRPDS